MWFILGVFLGAPLGLLVLAMLAVARERTHHERRLRELYVTMMLTVGGCAVAIAGETSRKLRRAACCDVSAGCSSPGPRQTTRR